MNIANILERTPIGTKLYSPTFGECTLVEVKNQNMNDFPIWVKDKKGTTVSFTPEGKFYKTIDCEIALFPSKENRDWSTVDKLLIDTTCVVWNGDLTELTLIGIRQYYKLHYTYSITKVGLSISGSWDHIVPLDKFDFENMSYKKEDDYGSCGQQ